MITIPPIWKGEEAYIIGGGRSLKDNEFDFSLLRGKNTIGCNSAFLLGEEICKVCIFGDYVWFLRFREQLKSYKGKIYTSLASLESENIPWINIVKRYESGIHTDGLGWNGNTGFNAINLALLFGAQKIYLLGFDMYLREEGKPNWHDQSFEKPNPAVYRKFLFYQNIIKRDIDKLFPDVEIHNVSDGSSRLTAFPVLDYKVFCERLKCSLYSC